MRCPADVVVQKYGGSSVATVEHIKAVVERARKGRELGLDLVVVVLAIGKTTDRLIALAGEVVGRDPAPGGIDRLLSTSELQSMVLHDCVVAATLLTGPQAGAKLQGATDRCDLRDTA